MSDHATADDSRYGEMFDITHEARASGVLIEDDLNLRFGRLREAAPVHPAFLKDLVDLPLARNPYTVPRPGYSCFSFAACDQAFRDNRTFSSELYREVGPTRAMGRTMLEMVGGEHRRYRSAFQSPFLKARTLGWWRTRWIDEIVAALVDKMAEADRADLNLQLCARLPVHTITRAIGMEGADALTFRSALLVMSHMAPATPEQQAEGARTVERMLFDLIERRRARPADDIVSHLLARPVRLDDGTEQPLTDQEIMANCRLIILAGGGTTWRQLGITLWALLTNVDQLAAVRADRGLLDAAVEESLRWNPTDPVFSRLVTVDTDLDGVAVPAGAILDICLGAGNRDPRRWDDPDRYDLFRPARWHLGFSVGPHRCLGMDVAKSEMTAALDALLDRFPNLRLDPDAPPPALTGGLDQRGVTALPVLLR